MQSADQVNLVEIRIDILLVVVLLLVLVLISMYNVSPPLLQMVCYGVVHGHYDNLCKNTTLTLINRIQTLARPAFPRGNVPYRLPISRWKTFQSKAVQL